MSLSSKGCLARANYERNLSDGSIIAEIVTFSTKIYKDKRKYVPDFKARVLLCDKGERIYTGDLIWIDNFYVKNCNEFYVRGKLPSYVITDWHIHKRNKFTKTKSEVEIEKEKIRQRKQIEEEIEAEEYELDEYIENNGEDDCPF